MKQVWLRFLERPFIISQSRPISPSFKFGPLNYVNSCVDNRLRGHFKVVACSIRSQHSRNQFKGLIRRAAEFLIDIFFFHNPHDQCGIRIDVFVDSPSWTNRKWGNLISQLTSISWRASKQARVLPTDTATSHPSRDWSNKNSPQCYQPDSPQSRGVK